MPEKCEKCEHDRFRQDGDAFVCKNCGHRHEPPKRGRDFGSRNRGDD